MRVPFSARLRATSMLFAAAAVMSGCGLVKVQGNVFGTGVGGAPASSPASGNAQASRAATSEKGAAPARPVGKPIHTVTLGPAIAQNPPAFLDVSVKADTAPKELGVTEFNDCFKGRLSSTPAVAITVPAAVKGTSVYVSGDVRGAVLLAPDNQYYCRTHERPEDFSVGPAEWKPGTYTLHILATEDGPQKVDVYVRDHEHKVAFDDKVRKETLNTAPATPLVISGPVRTRIFQRNDHCRGLFAEQPDAIIEATRPIGEMHLMLGWSPEKYRFRVEKLAASGGRPEGVYCEDDNELKFGNMEGRFAVYVGRSTRTDAGPYTLYAYGEKTERDMFQVAPTVPEKLATADRALPHHFPFLGDRHDDHATGDRIRQELFLRAPRQLFVYAKYDHDANSAKPWPSAYARYPKKGEPLLVLQDNGGDDLKVLAADAATYLIKRSGISEQPDGAVVVPTVSGVTILDRGRTANEQMTGPWEPEDAAVYAKYEAKDKAFDACADRIWDGVNPQIDVLHKSWWNANRDNQIDAIKDATDRQISAACGRPALDKLRQETYAKIQQQRAARRADRLAKIRARFESSK